jgi:hypothetical protein
MVSHTFFKRPSGADPVWDGSAGMITRPDFASAYAWANAAQETGNSAGDWAETGDLKVIPMVHKGYRNDILII